MGVQKAFCGSFLFPSCVVHRILFLFFPLAFHRGGFHVPFLPKDEAPVPDQDLEPSEDSLTPDNVEDLEEHSDIVSFGKVHCFGVPIGCCHMCGAMRQMWYCFVHTMLV